MKTKQVAPWHVKPGMKIVLNTLPKSMSRDGCPTSYEVTKVERGRGHFTGEITYRIFYRDHHGPLAYPSVLFHGRGKLLPANRVTIAIEP